MGTTRDASVVVIGAGDFIGAALARRFAAGGYLVFAGRRNGEKFSSLRRTVVRNGRDMEIEFHSDFGSPNAYLAHRVIPQIEHRSGARCRHVPVLLALRLKGAGS